VPPNTKLRLRRKSGTGIELFVDPVTDTSNKTTIQTTGTYPLKFDFYIVSTEGTQGDSSSVITSKYSIISEITPEIVGSSESNPVVQSNGVSIWKGIHVGTPAPKKEELYDKILNIVDNPDSTENPLFQYNIQIYQQGYNTQDQKEYTSYLYESPTSGTIKTQTQTFTTYVNNVLSSVTITQSGITINGQNISITQLFDTLNIGIISNFIQDSIPITVPQLNQYYNTKSQTNYLKNNSTINFVPTYTFNGITGILGKAIPQPTNANGSIFSFIIDTNPVIILDTFTTSANMITFKRNSNNKLAITLNGQTDNYLNVGEYITVPPGKPGDSISYLQYIAYGSPVVLLLTPTQPTPTPIPCLLKGTLVLTPYGFKKIEDLKEGQQITTHKGTSQKIIKIFHKYVKWSLDPFIDQQMYKVDGLKPLYISHWHKILRTDGLLYAGYLQLPLASKEELCELEDTFELYHIQLDDSTNNHLVVNNGIIVESWNGIQSL